MLDQYQHGRDAFVRVPSCRGVFHAEDIRGEWNGFPVPVFTHSEAWAILTAHGSEFVTEFGDDANGWIWYTDATTGERAHTLMHHDGLLSFDGWAWEFAPVVSREVVDAVSRHIVANLDMGIVTSMGMDEVEAWLADDAGEYANAEARDILDAYGETIRAEVVTWDLFETNFFRVLTQLVANA